MKFRAFIEYHLELNFFSISTSDYISVGKPSGCIFVHFLQGKGCHTYLMTNFFSLIYTNERRLQVTSSYTSKPIMEVTWRLLKTFYGAVLDIPSRP